MEKSARKLRRDLRRSLLTGFFQERPRNRFNFDKPSATYVSCYTCDKYSAEVLVHYEIKINYVKQ